MCTPALFCCSLLQSNLLRWRALSPVLVLFNTVRQLCDLDVCNRTSGFSRVEGWLIISSVKEEVHVSKVDKGRHVFTLLLSSHRKATYTFNVKSLHI